MTNLPKDFEPAPPKPGTPTQISDPAQLKEAARQAGLGGHDAASIEQGWASRESARSNQPPYDGLGG